MAAPCEQREYALNDAFEQAGQFCGRGCGDRMKHGLAILDAIHTVEHQTMKMDVEVRREPKRWIRVTAPV